MTAGATEASIVEAPKQRLSDPEKARLKGRCDGPRDWPDRPAKAAHQDTTARWTVKRDRRYRLIWRRRRRQRPDPGHGPVGGCDKPKIGL